METSLLKKALLTFAFMGITFNASAEWKLDNAESSIHFVSTKKSNVAEIHSFEKLSGSLQANGSANVVINLSSVETMIPIRNERMKEMLFKVEQFPESSVSTKVNYKLIDKMEAGESFTQLLQFKLTLHGEEKMVESDARVIKLANDKLLVSTIKPIMIEATDFSLGKGVEALRKIANLPTISTSVPVTANLIFNK